MPRGNWGIVFALVGWLILAAALPPQERGRAERHQAEQHVTGAPKPSAAAEGDNKAIQYNPPCERGRDNRRSDLCAQWKAADAAYESSIWTSHTYWLVLIGTVIGGLTLAAAVAAALFARKAALETEKGARAAGEAVKVTREIGEAQTRAYIDVEAVQPNWEPIRMYFTVTNSGASPAEDFSLWYGWRFHGPRHDIRSDGESGDLVPNKPFEVSKRLGAHTTTLQLLAQEVGSSLRAELFAFEAEPNTLELYLLDWRFAFRYRTIFGEWRQGIKEYRIPFYWATPEPPNVPHPSTGYLTVNHFAEWDEASEPERRW